MSDVVDRRSSIHRSLASVVALLPRGRTLTDAEWWPRHRAILVLLWAHVVAVPIYGVIQQFDVTHALLEGSAVAVAAVLATTTRYSRRIRGAAATIGLVTASAVLVHMSGGLIEMHFHFFVMIPVIALYQDWFPFLLAIGYVALHHGVAGALDPKSVYNHPAAIANPWEWATVHAGFILAISVVCLISWRLNETALAERRQAEDEVLDTLSVLTATLEATADGILVVGGDGRIVTFNRRFQEMWSIPDEVVASGNDDDAIETVLSQLKDPEAFLSKVRELYADPDAESFDEIEFLDGRIFERISRPQRIAGESVGRVWSFSDATHRRRHEQALKLAAQRDREAVKRLEDLDRSKNMFLTAVSHELRTPLTAVLGFAHTLRDHDGDVPADARQSFLDKLVGNAEQLQQLLMGLLDLDRISRGIVQPRLQRIDLAELVSRVVDSIDSDRDIRVHAEHVWAEADAGMIERVVENLVANAVKHTPAESPIEVAVASDLFGALIVVEDRGPGVPNALKETVFEAFIQGTVPEHSPGTGIGLSLVAQFVGLHGGRAWVEDRPGGGASFRVMLPSERAVLQDSPSLSIDAPKMTDR